MDTHSQGSVWIHSSWQKKYRADKKIALDGLYRVAAAEDNNNNNNNNNNKSRVNSRI